MPRIMLRSLRNCAAWASARARTSRSTGAAMAYSPEQFPRLAADLVNAKVDVIFCAGEAAVRVAQQATETIPILAVTDDMVGAGLVRSLAQPGSNTTGVSIFATELDGKRQDVVLEAVPRVRVLAALADMNTTTPQHLQSLQEAARRRGVELLAQRITRSEEVVPALDAAQAWNVAAINVLASPLLVANRRAIIERTAVLRLPAMYQWPEIAEEGGFIAYGPRLIETFRVLVAQQLVKLFRGAKPSDLPVEQPTRFELVINVRAAKALGLEMPLAYCPCRKVIE